MPARQVEVLLEAGDPALLGHGRDASVEALAPLAGVARSLELTPTVTGLPAGSTVTTADDYVAFVMVAAGSLPLD